MIVGRHAVVRWTGVRSPETGGRFGGGWDWKLGVQASRRFESVILSLVFVEIILRRRV